MKKGPRDVIVSRNCAARRTSMSSVLPVTVSRITPPKNPADVLITCDIDGDCDDGDTSGDDENNGDGDSDGDDDGDGDGDGQGSCTACGE